MPWTGDGTYKSKVPGGLGPSCASLTRPLGTQSQGVVCALTTAHAYTRLFYFCANLKTRVHATTCDFSPVPQGSPLHQSSLCRLRGRTKQFQNWPPTAPWETGSLTRAQYLCAVPSIQSKHFPKFLRLVHFVSVDVLLIHSGVGLICYILCSILSPPTFESGGNVRDCYGSRNQSKHKGVLRKEPCPPFPSAPPSHHFTILSPRAVTHFGFWFLLLVFLLHK